MLRAGSITQSDVDPKWQFEQESEASILGSHFAYSIAAIATGNKDKIANPKSNVKAFRKIFYEDPLNNPPLNQASVTAGFDSWSVEEQIHWNQKGTIFPQAVRKFGVPPDVGPKKPIEFPYVFERPIKAHERKGEIRPFSRVKTISSQARLHYNPPEKREDLPLSPDKYRLPDPWAETSRPILGIVHETSSFRSRTERFSSPGVSRPSSSMESRPHSPNMSKIQSSLVSSIDRLGTVSPPEISQSMTSNSLITQTNPTISTNGAPGAGNLQIGIDPSLSLSHSRPRTADTTKSSGSDQYSPSSLVKMKRAQSADTIRKNKVAGHTFAKFPRNTSAETKRIITKILTDPKLKRSTSGMSEPEESPQLNRFGLDLRLEIDIQPLHRNFHSNSFLSHPAVHIEPGPLLFDDDIVSLPMSGIAASNDESTPDMRQNSSPKHYANQQQYQLPNTRSILKKEEEIPDHHFVAALNQPTITPLRDSRPMCYSKKSFKDLFLLNEYNNHNHHHPDKLRSSVSTPTLQTKSRSPLYYNNHLQRSQSNRPLNNLSNSFDDYDYSQSPRRSPRKTPRKSPRKLSGTDRTPSPQGKSKLVAAQLYALHQQHQNNQLPPRQQQIHHPLSRKTNNRMVKTPPQKVVRIRLNVPMQKEDS